MTERNREQAQQRSRRLAIFVPAITTPTQVKQNVLSSQQTGVADGAQVSGGQLAAAVDKLGTITPAPAIQVIDSGSVLVSIAPEQEPTAMTTIFQTVIPNQLGLLDIDRATVLAYGDDLVRYPMTTAHYTLGWSSPRGIRDVLKAIYQQQTDTAYSRTDYVKIVDRQAAKTAEQQSSGQSLQADSQADSQWETQHYIQCFYSPTSGSVGTQGNIMADEGFWIEVRNGAAEMHFGIGGLDLDTATEVFRRWLAGERKFPDVGKWQKLII